MRRAARTPCRRPTASEVMELVRSTVASTAPRLCHDSQEACTSKPSSPGLVGEGVTLSLGCAPRPPPLHQFLPSCGAADAAWAIGVTVGPFAAARHRRCARSKTRAAACRATTDGQTISVFGEAVDEVAGH